MFNKLSNPKLWGRIYFKHLRAYRNHIVEKQVAWKKQMHLLKACFITDVIEKLYELTQLNCFL